MAHGGPNPYMAQFSFLPGPTKVAPHLADRLWKAACVKEEDYVLASARNRGGQRHNPLAWDNVFAPSRGGDTASSHRGTNVLQIDSSRLGTGATSQTVSSARSAPRSARSTQSSHSRVSSCNRSSRCGTSRLLGTAGSYRSGAYSEAGMSSILSMELEAEREQRKKTEVELEKLKAELHETRMALAGRT